MVILIKKILYVMLVLGINLYIVSFLNNKIVSRIELRRGYKGYRIGELIFPYSNSLKYISKRFSFSIWDILIFIFLILLWSVVPVTLNLVIINLDYGIFIALVFYILILVFKVFSVSHTKYNFIMGDFLRKMTQMFSLIIPMLFSIISIVILSKSLDFNVIVNSQYQCWNIIYQPVGFLVFFISMLLQIKLMNLSEHNQFLYFDNVSKEGEGISKLIERLSGYLILFFLIVLTNILYLGGWQKFYSIRGEIMVGIKFYLVFIFLVLFERSISNIYGVNKLINSIYKLLLPLSILNLIITVVFCILRNVYFII